MEWFPGRLLGDEAPETPYALLISNRPFNVRVYEKVAPHASMVICVDGGANHLQKILQPERPPFDRVSQSGRNFVHFPDAIIGDLDSLKDDVQDFFRDAGKTEIVRASDQDSTDLTKALRWLRKQMIADLGKRVDIVVLGGMGGRVDQGMSIIHHLFMAVSDPELLIGNMYLLSEMNLSFVLEKGHNLISGLAPNQNNKFQENIGIIPIRGPATISTKGLEWDVKDWNTAFGGQISTSNHIKADVVEIETSDQVLVTIELADALCAQ